MQIKSYFGQIRKKIMACAFLNSWQFEEDARTSTEGFFKARLIFTDESQLEFREYVNTSFRQPRRYTCSYHYQKMGVLIFRYDNTPHYPNLATFPHHKHIAPEVIESEAPELQSVLHEIETIIFSL